MKQLVKNKLNNFKTNKSLRDLLNGSFWIVLTQIVLTGISFLVSVVFARTQNPEIYGQFQFILSILGILGIFVIPGINNSTLIDLSKNNEGSIKKAIRTKLKLVIIPIIGLIITSSYFFFNNKIVISKILIVLIPLSPILYSLDICLLYFIAKKQFKNNFIFQIIIFGISNLTLIILLLYLKDIFIIFLIYFIVKSIGFLLAYFQIKNKLKNNKTDKDLVKYGIHLSLINAIPTTKRFLDKIILTYFLGFEITGIYSIANSFTEQINALIKSLNLLLFPKLSKKNKNTINKLVKSKLLITSSIFIVLMIIGILILPIIIQILFPENYYSSIKIAQLLLVVTIPYSIGFFLSKIIEIKKEKKKLYKINIIYSTVELILYIFLIPFLGIYGIIYSKLVSNTIYLLLNLKLIFK